MAYDARLLLIKEIFFAAKGLTGEARTNYLAEHCPDEATRFQIERMLEEADEMDTPTGAQDGHILTAVEEIPVFQPGGRLSHYRVGKRLGKGGMGIVYEAFDETLRRTVVLKIMAPGTINAENRKRFTREAQLASSLNHPNIVTVFEIGRENDADFIAMEKVAGRTLREEIGDHGLELGVALPYAAQIADALAAAHQAGIVHRDLKPGNLMVTEEGRIKVLDFGIAKSTASPLEGLSATITGAGQVIGSVAYMSPEQAEGRPVDTRSDIFSFGSVLFEMLTGQRSFRDTGATSLARLVQQEPPLHELPPALPRSIKHVLVKCLQQRPADRWQNMADVKIMLEAAIQDLGAPPEPASAIQERSPRGRHAWRWAAAGCLAGVLATAAALYRGGGSGTDAADRAMLRMVTSDSGLNSFPALSSDGKLLAFASDRSNEGHLDIWLQQIGGRDPVRLTHNPADEMDPAFSPDGTRIAYRSEANGGGIYVIPAIGKGDPILLARGGRKPRFSPDGKWLAYWAGREGSFVAGTARTYIVDSGGGEPRQIHPEMASAMFPAWSPDSRKLIVLGRKEGTLNATMDWWVLPVDGGTPKATGAIPQLRQQGLARIERGMGILWSVHDWTASAPQRLRFSAVLGDTANLWEFQLSAGDTVRGPARRLMQSPGRQVHAATVIAGGKQILALSDELLNYDVWSIDMDTDSASGRAEPRRLTNEKSPDWAPSISWDAKKLSYINRHAGSWSIRLMEPGVANEKALLSNPNLIVTTQLPGNGSAVFYSDVKGDIYVVPATGGAAEKLCGGCGIVTGASMDGSRFLYEPLDNEDLLAFDTRRGKTLKLALRRKEDNILSGGRLSPDDKWAVFHALNNVKATSQILVVRVDENGPVPSSAWIPVTDGTTMDREACWSPGGGMIYFVSEREGFACIWAQRVDATTKRPVGQAFAVRHFHSARLSLRAPAGTSSLTGLHAADGRLVFALSEFTGNIWLSESQPR